MLRYSRVKTVSLWVLIVLPALFAQTSTCDAKQRQSIPDKLVVLTFDDGCKSDITVAAPLLKKYGFGATFYVNKEGGFLENKQRYLTWDEVKQLHDDGFEIGNHTATHPYIRKLSKEQFSEEVEYIERKCREHGIAKPQTFCYTGFFDCLMAVEVLDEKDYLFARRGVGPEFFDSGRGSRGPAYDPTEDHPLLIPTTGYAGPGWNFDDFIWSLAQARDGKITVLCFHGVPYPDASWVSTEPDEFEKCMKYLHDNDYKVIGMRDLASYVGPEMAPTDPYGPIKRRMSIRPVELKCEYATDPLGVETLQPRFSWILESMRRDQEQIAYHVIVSSSKDKLADNIGDKWDSGKVVSGKSVNIPYQGKPLSSGENCYWKVRCWGKDDKTGRYSEPAACEMGLLKQSDFQGIWIGADEKIASPILRKEFEIPKKLKKARVYVSGLGWSELYINGSKVGEYGTHSGQFDSPQDACYDLQFDQLIVADTSNNRIQIFQLNNFGWFSSNEMTYADQINEIAGLDPPGLSGPMGIASKSSDTKQILYIADTGNNRVVKVEVEKDYPGRTPLHTWALFKAAGHGFSQAKPEDLAQAKDKAVAFFKRYVKNAKD